MENTSVHDHQNAQPQSMLETSSGGVSMAPPAFSLTAGGSEGGDGPVVQRQEAPAAQQPEVAGPASAANDWAGLPEEYRDPIANSNTVLQNVQLLISEWEGRDGGGDDRKLAYILATARHETAGTNQAIHEGLSDNYWPSRYADSGYWGRGFVQLTWEDNYSGMEDETSVDLSTHKEAALLPAISAIVTVDGMLDGDFTGRGLNRYIPSNENEQGEQVQGQADFFNARRTVNGTDGAQSIADHATEFLTGINNYRAGVEAGTITDRSLAEYLYFDTDLYDESQQADANRMLEALGYQNFTAPSFGADATAEQNEYVGDVEQTGYAWRLQRIDSQAERTAMINFQREFNQNHNLETPLPEDGSLNEATLRALTRAGNLISSGENMIDYAFGGDVEAINPVTQIFDQYQGGEATMAQLAARLVYLMPVPDAADVIGMFDTLGADAAILAFNLAISAPSHDDLAYFNRPILDRMQALLNASSNPQHTTMGRRIQCLFDYQPAAAAAGQHIEYRVVSGDSMSRIASRNNMTLQALLDYNAANGNPIADAGRINIGDRILLPNPDFDPDAQQVETPTCELSAFPLPEIQAPVETPTPTQDTPTPTTQGGDQQQGGDQAPAEQVGRLQRIFASIRDWLSNIFG